MDGPEGECEQHRDRSHSRTLDVRERLSLVFYGRRSLSAEEAMHDRVTKVSGR